MREGFDALTKEWLAKAQAQEALAAEEEVERLILFARGEHGGC